MSPSPEPTLARFTAAERWTHRVVAALVLVLLATAAGLYLPALSAVVGNRELVKTVHIVAGFALPVPIIVACCFAAFRLDVRRLNRFTPDDWPGCAPLTVDPAASRWASSTPARS